jgi:peroxiredoxin
MISKKLLAAAAGVALIGLPASAFAALSTGAKAPEFKATGALAGQPFSFDLNQALKKGPVVVYFFPKAETPGCNAEAAAFAQSMDDFKKAGAQVIGLSADNLDALKAFSVKHCSGAFPVATATPAIIKAYDVSLVNQGKDTGITNRTSYVIAKDGTIKLVHSDLNYVDHVKLTLAEVQGLKKG